jgi:hypothetical protein
MQGRIGQAVVDTTSNYAFHSSVFDIEVEVFKTMFQQLFTSGAGLFEDVREDECTVV